MEGSTAGGPIPQGSPFLSGVEEWLDVPRPTTSVARFGGGVNAGWRSAALEARHAWRWSGARSPLLRSARPGMKGSAWRAAPVVIVPPFGDGVNTRTRSAVACVPPAGGEVTLRSRLLEPTLSRSSRRPRRPRRHPRRRTFRSGVRTCSPRGASSECRAARVRIATSRTTAAPTNHQTIRPMVLREGARHTSGGWPQKGRPRGGEGIDPRAAPVFNLSPFGGGVNERTV